MEHVIIRWDIVKKQKTYVKQLLVVHFRLQGKG